MTPLFFIVIGAWMLAVGVHNNGVSALHFLTEQKAFVVWVFGLAILFGLMEVPKLRPVVKPLTVLALTALAVGRYRVVMDNVDAFKSHFGITTSGTPTNTKGAGTELQNVIKMPDLTHRIFGTG